MHNQWTKPESVVCPTADPDQYCLLSKVTWSPILQVASPTRARLGISTGPTGAKPCMPSSVNQSKSANSGGMTISNASTDIFGLLTNVHTKQGNTVHFTEAS